jgi:large subunit ribosomal protein L11
MKSPPASVLIKKALGLPSGKKPGSGSKEPNKIKVGTITMEQIRGVAKEKLNDMNTTDIEAAMRSIAGTAKSLGVDVVA